MKEKLVKKNIAIVAVGVLLLLGAGFTGGYQYRSYEISKAITDAFSEKESNDPEPDSTGGKQGLKSNYYQQSDTIKFSTQTLKVNSASATTTLTAEYGTPWIASQGTKFIVVDHTVVNTLTSPFSYMAFQLFTDDGKQYDASDQVFGKVDNYLNVRQLAPGVPESGVVVFVVPDSVKNVEFGGRNGSTDVLELVKLRVE